MEKFEELFIKMAGWFIVFGLGYFILHLTLYYADLLKKAMNEVAR
jgi:hypothetical protein